MNLNFGWQREDIIRFLETMYDPQNTAKTVSAMLTGECGKLYGGHPGTIPPPAPSVSGGGGPSR